MSSGAGLGLRAPHYRELYERRPALAFLEVHGENFFGDGGQPLAWLERFRALYPVSLHGVGLSLGSADPLDRTHLARLERLVRRVEPGMVSEHLSWSSIDGRYANDLLPLPFTSQCLDHVVRRVGEVQDRLQRQVLIENVSAYVGFPESEMPEWTFLAEVARRSGCGILLDVNNVWVNATNHGFDPHEYIDAIPGVLVGEYHLAGFERTPEALIDTHGEAIAKPVWGLFAYALARIGPRPTLIERDQNIPALDTMLAEVRQAGALLEAPLELETV